MQEERAVTWGVVPVNAQPYIGATRDVFDLGAEPTLTNNVFEPMPVRLKPPQPSNEVLVLAKDDVERSCPQLTPPPDPPLSGAWGSCSYGSDYGLTLGGAGLGLSGDGYTAAFGVDDGSMGMASNGFFGTRTWGTANSGVVAPASNWRFPPVPSHNGLPKGGPARPMVKAGNLAIQLGRGTAGAIDSIKFAGRELLRRTARKGTALQLSVAANIPPGGNDQQRRANEAGAVSDASPSRSSSKLVAIFGAAGSSSAYTRSQAAWWRRGGLTPGGARVAPKATLSPFAISKRVIARPGGFDYNAAVHVPASESPRHLRIATRFQLHKSLNRAMAFDGRAGRWVPLAKSRTLSVSRFWALAITDKTGAIMVGVCLRDFPRPPMGSRLAPRAYYAVNVTPRGTVVGVVHQLGSRGGAIPLPARAYTYKLQFSIGTMRTVSVNLGRLCTSLPRSTWNLWVGQQGYGSTGQVFAPRDSDGDGIPDWRDPDDDNDGIPDGAMWGGGRWGPRGPGGWGSVGYGGYGPGGNWGWGGGRFGRRRFRDSDGDGIPDWRDNDDDNDGIPDWRDRRFGPNGRRRWKDSDHDGIPDWRDRDDDNDGIPDWRDKWPKRRNNGKWKDSDRDGIPDWRDNDDDNDGIPDWRDKWPKRRNNNKWKDSDHDGIPDWKDRDDDNDGIPDWRDPKFGIGGKLRTRKCAVVKSNACIARGCRLRDPRAACRACTHCKWVREKPAARVRRCILRKTSPCLAYGCTVTDKRPGCKQCIKCSMVRKGAVPPVGSTVKKNCRVLTTNACRANRCYSVRDARAVCRPCVRCTTVAALAPSLPGTTSQCKVKNNARCKNCALNSTVRRCHGCTVCVTKAPAPMGTGGTIRKACRIAGSAQCKGCTLYSKSNKCKGCIQCTTQRAVVPLVPKKKRVVRKKKK